MRSMAMLMEAHGGHPWGTHEPPSNHASTSATSLLLLLPLGDEGVLSSSSTLICHPVVFLPVPTHGPHFALASWGSNTKMASCRWFWGGFFCSCCLQRVHPFLDDRLITFIMTVE